MLYGDYPVLKVFPTHFTNLLTENSSSGKESDARDLEWGFSSNKNQKGLPMILEINPKHPEPRKIKQVVEVLANGGIIAYPTDTTMALAAISLTRNHRERSTS